MSCYEAQLLCLGFFVDLMGSAWGDQVDELQAFCCEGVGHVDVIDVPRIKFTHCRNDGHDTCIRRVIHSIVQVKTGRLLWREIGHTNKTRIG